jgi:hypothetical protein
VNPQLFKILRKSLPPIAIFFAFVAAITYLTCTYMSDQNPWLRKLWQVSASAGLIAWILEMACRRFDAGDAKASRNELETTKMLAAKLKFQSTPQEIPAENRPAFTDSVSTFNGQKFMIFCADEQIDRIFATDLAMLLIQCGWIHPSGLRQLAIHPFKLYQLPPPGIRVCLPFRFGKPEPSSIEAAVALFYALEKSGIGMVKYPSNHYPEIDDISDSGPDVVEIRIGPKADPAEKS